MPRDQPSVHYNGSAPTPKDILDTGKDGTGRKRKAAELEMIDSNAKTQATSMFSKQGILHFRKHDASASDPTRGSPVSSTLMSSIGAADIRTSDRVKSSQEVAVPVLEILRDPSYRKPLPPSDTIHSLSLFTSARPSRNGTDDNGSGNLPDELVELAQLHSAFLRALSLHYAHNGLQTPLDTRVLCESISRIWGKRKVLLPDIQHILAIQKDNLPKDIIRPTLMPELCLIDYGHARICIEFLVQSDTESSGSLLQEDTLHVMFLTNLRRLFEQCCQSTDQETFPTDSCPVEPIRQYSQRSASSSTPSKGKQKLDLFRFGALPVAPGSENTKAQPMKTQDGSVPKISLRERLRAKGTQEAGPTKTTTKDALTARAALQRVEDVAAIISLLSTAASFGQPRISFTLGAVLGKLKESSKTPISAEEGETAVRLLAEAVAPEWMKLARIGNSDKIIVQKENKPTEERIKTVLQNLAACDGASLSSN